MTSSLRKARWASLALVALVAAGCGTSDDSSSDGTADSSASTVVVENAKPTLELVEEEGEKFYQEDQDVARASVTVPANPASVVVFDIATLDTMHAIGAGSAVKGIPDIGPPEYLSTYKDLPKVGTLFEPDYEAVADLDPDLIVTAARSTGAYDELSKLGTTIDLTAAFAGKFDPSAGTKRAEQVGQIFGKEKEVTAAVTEINDLVTKLKAEASGTALVLSVSGGEYGAFGEGSRFGYFFDELGWSPAVPAAQLPGEKGSPHGDTVTNEFILKANPDWIFAFDRGAATGETASAEQALDNELVARTTAAKEGHIVYLPASDLYIVINGVTSMKNVLTSIHDAVTR